MNNTETLILWYLRFNGYFTTPNFTTHPDLKKEPGSSDADVLAVRFQHSEESQERFDFERDTHLIQECPIDIVLADVKSSMCALNENWTRPQFENVEYALRWVGRWKDSSTISQIAKAIYQVGEWKADGNTERVRFISFGKTENETLRPRYPGVLQILFSDVIRFMRSRMTKSCYQIHRERWEPFIEKLGCRFKDNQPDAKILEWVTGKKF